MLLPDFVLERCTRLESHDELRALLVEVRAATAGSSPEAAQAALDSGEARNQAAALLYSAASGWLPEVARLRAAFQSDSSALLAAAALCVATRFPEDDVGRRLLLGRDSWTAPEAGPNARYAIIEAMRLSGNECFIPILYDALREHFHYNPRPHTLRALEALGASLDPEKKQTYLHSISVTPAQQQILITTDERYGGRSNCIHCRFFPCRINHRFAMGIEDCKLWNRIDSKSLGDIEDMKGWGGNTEHVDVAPFDDMLRMACQLLERGEPCQAIPHLCSMLIKANLNNTLLAVAWINLARILDACDERVLAFVAMREGARFPNLVGASDRAEKAALDRFVDDPEAFTGLQLPKERKHRLGLRAEGYKEHGLYTRALDCYLEQNIYEGGGGGGTWFEMGECHWELGEEYLAELFMRLGAHRTSVRDLRLKFLAAAHSVRALRLAATDPGLALNRRAADRAAADPPNLCT